MLLTLVSLIHHSMKLLLLELLFECLWIRESTLKWGTWRLRLGITVYFLTMPILVIVHVTLCILNRGHLRTCLVRWCWLMVGLGYCWWLEFRSHHWKSRWSVIALTHILLSTRLIKWLTLLVEWRSLVLHLTKRTKCIGILVLERLHVILILMTLKHGVLKMALEGISLEWKWACLRLRWNLLNRAKLRLIEGWLSWFNRASERHVTLLTFFYWRGFVNRVRILKIFLNLACRDCLLAINPLALNDMLIFHIHDFA